MVPTQLTVGQTGEDLRDGRADVAFMCGLAFMRLVSKHPSDNGVEVIAEPVLHAQRYAGRPVYFPILSSAPTARIRSGAVLRGCT